MVARSWRTSELFSELQKDEWRSRAKPLASRTSKEGIAKPWGSRVPKAARPGERPFGRGATPLGTCRPKRIWRYIGNGPPSPKLWWAASAAPRLEKGGMGETNRRFVSRDSVFPAPLNVPGSIGAGPAAGPKSGVVLTLSGTLSSPLWGRAPRGTAGIHHKSRPLIQSEGVW